MKPLIMHFSLSSCYFLPHRLSRHPQSVLFSWDETKFYTHVKEGKDEYERFQADVEVIPAYLISFYLLCECGLICWCHFQVSGLGKIVIMILPCILVMEHEHLFNFLIVYQPSYIIIIFIIFISHIAFERN
jgi:hypothetical protein